MDKKPDTQSTKTKATRGRMSRIQQLPEEIKETLDKLLRGGVSQVDILKQLNPLLEQNGEKPLSAAGLNRYSTKMELVGKKVREAREVAKVWTAKFGDEPTGEVSQHIIEILRTLAFDMVLDADNLKDDEGNPLLSPSMINELALAVQRMERAAELSTKREKELRKAMAAKAEKEVKKAGVSQDTAAAIRAALEASDV